MTVASGTDVLAGEILVLAVAAAAVVAVAAVAGDDGVAAAGGSGDAAAAEEWGGGESVGGAGAGEQPQDGVGCLGALREKTAEASQAHEHVRTAHIADHTPVAFPVHSGL